MDKLRKRFKKETGEDYLIEVNKSDSNTEFNWQYVKWLEEQIVSKNELLHDVSLSFEAKEKIIDLHGYVTEIEEVDGDVVWFYDQNGEYMSLRKKYVKRYSS